MENRKPSNRISMIQCLNRSMTQYRAWVRSRTRSRRWRGYRWRTGRISRIRFRHLFSWTSQGGRVRGTFFLLLGNGWFTQIHFLFDTHDFLAIHLHGLDPHDFVANEAYKIYVLRGHDVDPFLVLNFIGMLAHFLWRTSLRVDHHVVVHSHQHMVSFDGILDLGRNGFQIGIERRFGIEIKHRAQHPLQLWSGHLRNIFVEVKIDERAAG